MTDKDNNLQIEIKSNNDVWDDWIMRSENPGEFSMKEILKTFIFDEGVFGNDLLSIIMNFESSDHLEILNLILNHCDDNEKPRNISLEKAFEIFYNMESDEFYESDHNIEYDDGTTKNVIVPQKVYKVKDFLKKVDEL